MATNIEKKITKSVVFGAGMEWLNTMAPDTVVGVRTVSAGGEEISVEITAGMLAEKLAHEVELLGKKNSPSKLTPQQVANRGLGEMVVDFLREHEGERFTVTELMKQVEGLPAEITNQRMTGLFRLDSVQPFVSRTMEKGRAYFQYAG